MNKGTKKLITDSMKREISSLERAIESCKRMPRPGDELHIRKMENKISRLRQAIQLVNDLPA